MGEIWSSVLIAVVSLIIGGWTTHALSRRRDLLNKKREIQFRYLIDAYRSLEKCAYPKGGYSDPGLIESAIADIQLFGTAAQVTMAHKVALGMAETGEASITELLEELRRDLRQSLRMQQAETKVLHFRLKIDPAKRVV